MSFWLFLLYYFICSLILGLVLVLLYRLFIKKKCFDVSLITEKAIDDYFSAYDDTFSKSEFPQKFDNGDDTHVNNINR